MPEQKHHDYLYWEFHETDQIGVRKGDWKLVVVKGEPRLYNLASDIHEDHNVAAEHPEILAKTLLAAIQKGASETARISKITLPEFKENDSD